MKTAISIDGELLQKADEAAKSMGLSRSRLFTVAINDLLQRQQKEEMLSLLNKVYADIGNASELRLIKRFRSKVRSTLKDRW